MHYFVRHPAQPLVVVFGPKGACQTLRKWITDTVDDPTAEPLRVDEYLVDRAVVERLDGHHKVLVVRNPLRRVVSFYAQFVVADQRTWCFADHEQRFPLHHKSFRQLLLVLAHLHSHRLRFQHHLEPQVLGIEGMAFDEILTVERLAEGIAGLNRRFGFTAALEHRNRQHYADVGGGLAGDRSPRWLRRNGLPPWERFFDQECTALAERIYAHDIALYRTSAAPAAAG